MKKWIVRIFGALVGIIILVVAIAAIMLATFDPNAYKGQITTATKEATGRDLVIAGDIGITVFPVLGFEVKDVTLGNPPGFTEKDFLSVSTVRAGVKLVPLFSRNVEITEVLIDSPNIHAIKLQNGTSNLTFSKPGAAKKAETGQEQKAGMNSFSIDSIKISNASVIYDDRMTGKELAIAPMNLTLPGFAKNKKTPFAADLVMKDKKAGSETALDMKADIKLDPDSGIYELMGLNGNIALTPAGGKKTSVSLNGDAKADTKAQEITLSNLKASIQGMSATGNVSIKNFSKPAISFKLDIPKLDIDSLAQPKKEKTTKAGGELLPVEALRSLTLDGHINIAALKASGLTATNAQVGIKAINGLITLDPLSLNAYEGTETNRIVIDARRDVPSFTVTGKAENIQSGLLLKDKMGQDYITGTVDADYNITATGNTVKALQDTSGGTVKLSFSNGAINKWQLSKLLNQAIAFFETGKMNANVGDSFRFTSMNADWTGQNGLFSNNDLVVIAPASHVLGSGTINLREQTVNYGLKAGMGDNPETFETAKHLPIKISGPFSKPRYGLDFEAAATEAVKEKLNKTLEEGMSSLLGGSGTQEPAAETEGGTGTEEIPSPAGMIKGLLGQ